MRLALLGLLVLSACDLATDVQTSSHVGVDAPSGGSNETDGGTHPPADAPAITCKDPVLSVGNGHHNAGMDCLDGCHNHGFSFAGTLYMPGTTTPMVGATVTAFDASGHTADAISQANGNFSSSAQLQFPITVVVSSCPDLTKMTGSIPQGSGGCNKTGCHAASGGEGRIHLP